jgi:hypothetical protein
VEVRDNHGDSSRQINGGAHAISSRRLNVYNAPTTPLSHDLSTWRPKMQSCRLAFVAQHLDHAPYGFG